MRRAGHTALHPLEDGLSFRLETAFLNVVPENNRKATFWTGLPAGTPLGHATGGGAIQLSRIVGPFVQTAPDTFRYSPGRAEYTANRRNQDLWIMVSHPGDERFKSIVQQAMVHVDLNKNGKPQQINFPAIPGQKADTRTLELAATSDAGLPVSYYVREGPAGVEGDTLKFTAIPPRAKFPVRVTVVAWQFGRATDPKIQSAEPVERTFSITK